jgi:hypothetical protein
MKKLLEAILRLLSRRGSAPPSEPGAYLLQVPEPYDAIMMVPVTHLGHRLFVSADYIHAGGKRQPLALHTAETLAAVTGTVLPSPALVNSIWRQSQVKLTPAPIPWHADNVTQRVFDQHHRMIEDQLRGTQVGPTTLIAGHKKDVVHGSFAHPGRLAIYGWHRPDGDPIQPLSDVHGAFYADYSHGVRLVSVKATNLSTGAVVDTLSLY